MHHSAEMKSCICLQSVNSVKFNCLIKVAEASSYYNRSILKAADGLGSSGVTIL